MALTKRLDLVKKLGKHSLERFNLILEELV